MQKTKHWLLTIAVLLCSMAANAHDFKKGGIYYNFISKTDLTVEVTYCGETCDEYSDEYTGLVTIPEVVEYNNKEYSVIAIGDDAFACCTNLTSIDIPESVTAIGDEAFEGCSNLAPIDVPESVIAVGAWAFNGCRITSITIPENAVDLEEDECYIDEDAFDGCNVERVVFNCSGVGPWFARHEELKEVVLGENVIAIVDFAFWNCSGLTSINIPKSVTWIGEKAFWGCSGLTSIVIPEGVTEIGEYAFYECSALTFVSLPKSIVTLENNAFEGCNNIVSVMIDCPDVGIWFRNISSLKKVTLGENVNRIRDYAFRGCSSLASVNIPKGVTQIGDCVFYLCSSLECVTIDCPYIEDYCLTNEDGIKKIVLSENVKKIGTGAFQFCRNLQTLEIGCNVEDIGSVAFAGCASVDTLIVKGSVALDIWSESEGLKMIVLHSPVPPRGSYSIPSEFVCNNCTLCIPWGTQEAYEKADPWCYFLKMVPFDANGTNGVMPVDFHSAPVVYDLNGCRVDNPSRGVYIVNGRKVMVK